MVRFVFCLSWLSSAALAAGFDPPDLSFEYELHRQYLVQKGVAPQPSVMKDGRAENYQIQGGETLWSLSELLYGDGQYWPKVWAQNKAITNPNLIRPGHTLQFMMGSEDDTPAFRFSEADEEENAGIELVASNSPVIEIPPPEVPPKPVLRIPPSFPEWQAVLKASDDIGVDDRGLKYVPTEAEDRIFLRSYVQEEELVPDGEFLETDIEAGMPVVNQYIFVKMQKGKGGIGRKVLLVRNAGRVKRLNDSWESEARPYVVEVLAEAVITEPGKADWSRRQNEKWDAYRALITKTTALTYKGASVLVGEMPMADLTERGRSGTTQAQIIGSEKSEASAMYGPGEIVYLNKGHKHGLEVGQLLDIYVNRTTRHMNTPIEYSPASSGRIKVVRVTDKLATAVILKSRDGIQQGDRVQEITENSAAEKADPPPKSRTLFEGVFDGDSSGGG